MSTWPKSRSSVVFQKLTREQLEQATKQQLIELVLVLQDQVEQFLVQNQLLEARVAELERRLGMDSSNSSKPPSSDPTASKAKRRRRKKKAKRKRGAQHGHQGSHRELAPPDKVDHLSIIRPRICEKCGGIHLVINDADPWRHQVWEIPEIKPIISEWQMVTGTCKDCGNITQAKLPPGVPRGNFGTKTTVVVSLLAGVYHQSKRFIKSLMADVFGIDMSLGAISACEKKASKAIEEPVSEAHRHAQKCGVMYADETGWRQCNKKAWLWVAVTSAVTVFMVHLSRGRTAARKLLGNFGGILGTDRWSPYRVHAGLRQFCWAHLVRRFRGFSEMKGEAGRIGSRLLDATKLMFQWWHKIRDGTMTSKTFRRRMTKLRIEIGDLLVEGEICGVSPVAGVCKRLLAEEEHLWTFVDHEGIEPTNNNAERAVRQGVLWRKVSFGTQSEEGSRFVERIMTVSATCRQQKRSVIDYLNEACRAQLHGHPAPSLLPSTSQTT